MTVKVMAGEAAVEAPETARLTGKSVRERVADPPVEQKQSDLLWEAGGGEYISRRVSRRRRARGSFGDVLFVQLILSALLAGGVWSGLTFGGDEVREICISIMKLFG